MANLPEFVVAYHACFRAGLIAAPLNIRFKTAELRPLLRRLQPSLYIGQAALYSHVVSVESSILPANSRFVVDGPVNDVEQYQQLGVDQFSLLYVVGYFVSPPPWVITEVSWVSVEDDDIVHRDGVSAIVGFIPKFHGLSDAVGQSDLKFTDSPASAFEYPGRIKS